MHSELFNIFMFYIFNGKDIPYTVEIKRNKKYAYALSNYYQSKLLIRELQINLIFLS